MEPMTVYWRGFWETDQKAREIMANLAAIVVRHQDDLAAARSIFFSESFAGSYFATTF